MFREIFNLTLQIHDKQITSTAQHENSYKSTSTCMVLWTVKYMVFEHTHYKRWKTGTRLVQQWWKTCGFHSSRLYQTYPYVKLKSHSTHLSETSQVLQLVDHVRCVPLQIMEAMLSMCFQCGNDSTKELI